MPTFTFQDIFKSSFLERLDAVSLPDAAIALALAFCLGLFIFLVYKKCYAGVMYAPSFGVTLIALTLITTLLILAVTSNIVLSLGMVGALSIVRFRTAVKDPMDTVYMFWAIAVGITVGANFILFSIIGTLVIAVILLVLSFTSNQTGQNYLLVVHYDDRYAKEVTNAVNKMVPRYRLKSKTATRNGVEMTLELRLQGNRSNIVDNLLGIPGVMDATLVAFQNEIA